MGAFCFEVRRTSHFAASDKSEFWRSHKEHKAEDTTATDLPEKSEWRFRELAFSSSARCAESGSELERRAKWTKPAVDGVRSASAISGALNAATFCGKL